MKIKLHGLNIALALMALLTLNLQLTSAQAQGAAFTYQGQLQNSNGPVHGTYNFTFSLFATNVNGAAIAQPVTNNGVVITNGLFTVAIDFGSSVWNGETNWLQIAVETNGAGTFTNLGPRQQLTPAPYAIFAETSSNLSGTVSLSQLPAGIVTNNEASVTLNSVTVTGNLNLESGTVDSFGTSLLVFGSFGNFFAGLNAGNATMSGADNTAIGDYPLNLNTSGSNNTAVGYLALSQNTKGSDNAANGFSALSANISGSNNVAIGSRTLEKSTNESDLVAVGYEALQSNSNGHDNTADGAFALNDNTSGDNNTAVGFRALAFLADGSNNIVLGYTAGQSFVADESDNIDVGNGGTAGESGITRIGTPGIQTSTYLAGNVGFDGGLNLDNSGTYGQNTGNVISNAMTFGTGPGGSGEGIASKRVGTNPFDLEFYTAFVNRMTILSSGDVGIGTTNPDALLSVNGSADKPGGGSWSTFSDGRLKDVGADFTHGLEALDAIQPVHYHYKPGNPLNLPSQPDYVGVVAQQVQGAIPEAVQRNQDGYLVVNNDPIIWTMFNAIKELDQKRATEEKAKDAEIQTLKQQNDSLAQRLGELEATVKQLAAQK